MGCRDHREQICLTTGQFDTGDKNKWQSGDMHRRVNMGKGMKTLKTVILGKSKEIYRKQHKIAKEVKGRKKTNQRFRGRREVLHLNSNGLCKKCMWNE